MPCWETSHTRRKSCAHKDPKSDGPAMFWEGEEDNDIGKHRFSLCCILNLHVLSNITLPSMCAFPFCAVNCVTYKKKKKKISRWVKRQKQVMYGSVQVVERLIISLWGEGWVSFTCWERGCDDGGSKRGERKFTSVWKFNFYSVNGAFIGHVTLLPSQLPVTLYDV